MPAPEINSYKNINLPPNTQINSKKINQINKKFNAKIGEKSIPKMQK